MKCDKCDKEATVHEVNIKGGKPHERHLCEHCAREEGMAVNQVHVPVDKVFKAYIASQSAPPGPPTAPVAPAAASATSCPTCGLTFAQFRATGMLGCPACYTAFEHQLGPLLARAHEGGTHHVGKVPVSAGGAPSVAQTPARASLGPDPVLQQRVALLRRGLEEAIAGEQYEKAAKLRDEIQRLLQSAAGGAPASIRPGPVPGRGVSGDRP